MRSPTSTSCARGACSTGSRRDELGLPRRVDAHGLRLRRGRHGPRGGTRPFDDELAARVREMVMEAVDAEAQFAEDLLGQGVAGLSTTDMRSYLEYVADQRMERLDLPRIYGSKNPLLFMELQDVQELSNFFERRVSAYQVGVSGSVSFDDDF
ncbi:ribonucleotide-diphosphate reductase subunit beta [Nocardioides ungokensis]|uniref:ribonucleotide-diphosphate reductase subunit beta n=1 Tax=Nocardioides ungokensis TaxID=1643322 RepID=UPI002483E614|nr:ribonucleotide-diphosphate reductase subunit beta [Nocardioides ungokensis]